MGERPVLAAQVGQVAVGPVRAPVPALGVVPRHGAPAVLTERALEADLVAVADHGDAGQGEHHRGRGLEQVVVAPDQGGDPGGVVRAEQVEGVR